MLKHLRIYYKFVSRYKLKFIFFSVVLIVAYGFESVQPYFFKLFVDEIPNNNHQVLLNILFVYIVVRFAANLFHVATRWLGDSILIPLARDIRVRVFEQIQELDFTFHLSKSTGSLISSFKRGDMSVFSIFHIINIEITGILVSFLVLLFFFAQINLLLVGLMILTFLINLLLAGYLIKRNVQARREFNKSEDQVSAILVDNMINFETVKLFAQEKAELVRLKNQFVDWMNKLWDYANTFRSIELSVGAIGNLGLLAVLWLGLKQYNQFEITAGDYIMILSFVTSFYQRFFQLIFKLRDLAKHQVDIEKYFEPLSIASQVKDPIHPKKITKVKGEISFKNLSYSYEDGKKNAVKNINLKIRQGQSVAFVGHSGVGKTTLIKLLLRFFDPEKGSIAIDGVNIKDLTKSKLRSLIGVVPQEPILFNNTIAYNIRYGSENISQKQLESAAKTANLYEFIQDLPKAFQTHVGERGIKLSGGQKQRLAIARMILSNPQIIIFDEATSQLDSESEQKIQEAFWKVSKNKTTIIIAHRLSTVVRADKIVVMKEGKIEEIGSHRELVNKDGLYAHFWKLQSLG